MTANESALKNYQDFVKNLDIKASVDSSSCGMEGYQLNLQRKIIDTDNRTDTIHNQICTGQTTKPLVTQQISKQL